MFLADHSSYITCIQLHLKTIFSSLHLSSTHARQSVASAVVCVVWAVLYAGCQLAVELISGLPLRLADPIRLWKLGWLDWHTPSNPASNRLWPYTGVWLLRTSQSRPVQAFLNNPNKDHRGLFLTASPCRFSGVLHACLEEVSSYLFILAVKHVKVILKVWIPFCFQSTGGTLCCLPFYPRI